MRGNAKHFWKGFRIGLGQGAMIGGPCLMIAGCVLGLFTPLRDAWAAYMTIICGGIIGYLGRRVYFQERE